MTSPRYGWAWQQLRPRILARDGYICADCGGRANSVDHIVPIVEGGTDDPSNLRAMCGSCNSRRAAEWNRANRRRTSLKGSPRAGRVYPGALGHDA